MADKDYQKIASDMLDPQYNQKILALRNALNQNITNLDNSKAGINQNYDSQVENQNRANSLAKENFNNNTLSRGLSRSTIATSGLGGIDNTNQRLVNNINSSRTSTLNDVENQKAMLLNNLNNTITSLEADKMKEALGLGNQLQQQDITNELNNKQFEFSQQTEKNNEAFNQARFDWEKQQAEIQRQIEERRYQDSLKQQALENALKQRAASSKAASSTPKFNATLFDQAKKENYAKMFQAYMNLRKTDPDEADRFINENAGDFIASSDQKTFDSLMASHNDWYDTYTTKLKKNNTSSTSSSGGGIGSLLNKLWGGLKSIF